LNREKERYSVSFITKRRLASLASASALIATVAVAAAPTAAFAATVQPRSLSAAAVSGTVNYTGQGTTNGVLNTDLGGETPYLLWVFNGGKNVTSATINLPDGSHPMEKSGNGFKFQSNFFPITDLIRTATVTYTGTASNAVLTISHGHAVAPAPVCPAPLPAPATVASASGDVTWDVSGGYNGSPLTGTVVFDANNETGGTLAYTNSLGWNLTADVTPGTVVRDGNAVTFDGTITSTNAYGGGGYIHAKVVDGGGATCGGDTIVVFVNEPAYDGIFANVTSGDLVIH
jgi:hypothetical protein